MNKKVIITIVILVLLAVCAVVVIQFLPKPEKPEENTNEKVEEVVDETLVKINGLDFHLDKEAEFKDLKYTIVSDFKEANMEKYIQYNYYQEDSTNLLYFRIFNYGTKSAEEAMTDLGVEGEITYTDGKTDKLEYKLYASPRDDGGTMHFYLINKNGNLYVVNFTSKYDINDFEEKVLKSIN